MLQTRLLGCEDGVRPREYDVCRASLSIHVASLLSKHSKHCHCQGMSQACHMPAPECHVANEASGVLHLLLSSDLVMLCCPRHVAVAFVGRGSEENRMLQGRRGEREREKSLLTIKK
jgi:hypothetical protein